MSKSRYMEIQDKLMRFVPVSCFFLSLLSVAEDRLADRGEKLEDTRIDFIGAYLEAKAHGWLDKDNNMTNDTAFLECLTGDKVMKRIAEPTEVLNIADNEYTIAKYVFGSNTHFRRRLYDVYADSVTVKRGHHEKTYVYKFTRRQS